MRFLAVFVILISFITHSYAQELFKTDSFSYYQIDGSSKSKALIFLHGSVSYYLNVEPEQTQFSELLEGNSYFLNSFSEYSIYMPVVSKSFNWLNTATVSSLFQNIPNISGFDTLIIAGFSDGGTGAYRMFYTAQDSFDGLVVFNGYPQSEWFNKKVDYSLNIHKPVVFVSQHGDKVLRYEFLMTEYRIQKIYNSKTYLYITQGKHEYGKYTKQDFTTIKSCLTDDIKSNFNQMGLPIDGFVRQNIVFEMYYFRKRIGKRYSITNEYLSANTSHRDIKRLNKIASKSCLRRKTYMVHFEEVDKDQTTMSRKLKLVGCSWDYDDCNFQISVPNAAVNFAF